jgi:hypothetical protein
MSEKLPLTQVAAALRYLTGSTPPRYQQLWRAMVDGKISGELVNGRYVVQRADLPIIAAAMGMTVPGVSPQRQRVKAAKISA